jgi:hypothetical protein
VDPDIEPLGSHIPKIGKHNARLQIIRLLQGALELVDLHGDILGLPHLLDGRAQ